MPIYFSTNGYGYTYKKDKQRKKSKFSKILIRIFFIMLIMLIITISIFVFVLPMSKNKDKNVILYALQVAEYDNYSSAENMSKNIQQKGGAGYIYILDNNYKVLISCYKNIEDAEKVQKNLNDSGYQLEIINLDIKSYEKINGFSNKQNENYILAQNLFIDNYSQLYDLSVLYDTNDITINELKTKLNEIYYNNSEIIDNFDDEFNGVGESEIVYLKIYLSRLQQLINNLLLTNSQFDYLLKETYFNIIFLRI